MRHTFRYVVGHDPADGEEITLAEADSHHLARVVRRRAGDEVEVITPGAALIGCLVIDAGPPSVLRVTGPRRPGPQVPAVHLWVGLADAGRLDLVAEKAAELGVVGLGVMVTARARRVPDEGAWAKRADRMARVAEAAARQSGRGTWPSPGPLVPFDHVLDHIVPGQGVMLDPREAAPLADILRARPPDQPVTILVGPDTGFDDAEVAAAQAAGVVTAGLGDGMLRAETAAIAAAVMATMGRDAPGEG